MNSLEKKIVGFGILVLFVLHGLVLIVGANNFNVPFNKGSSTSSVHEYSTTAPSSINLFVDPRLFDSSVRERGVLIVFKSFDDMEDAVGIIRSKQLAEVYYIYKLIPAILVGGISNMQKFTRLITELEGISAHISFYSNKLYEIPKFFTLKQTLKSSSPTTTNSTRTMGAPTFWENGYNGTNVKVCVIDTGVNPDHPELKDKVVAAESFVKKIYGLEREIDDPTDENGHGTAVAGIIAGRGIDPRGLGVAPGALIMNARVFSKKGATTLAAIIAAIEWAVFGPDGIPNTGDEADIINMSLGGGEEYFSPSWLAVAEATRLGVTVVIAAGNEGDAGLRSMSISDPGNSPMAITVGATDPFYTDMHFSYSSIGPTILRAVKPDVVAPSGVIVLDFRDGYTSDPWMGTSFATPHVSGAVALIIDYLKSKNISRSLFPVLSRLVLLKTASPIISNVYYRAYDELIRGAGAVNLTRAYEMLLNNIISADTVPQMLHILPSHLPVGISNESSLLHEEFFPYFDRLFLGQKLAFNFSISVVFNTTIEVLLRGNISEALILHSPLRFNVSAPVSYWEFNATVNSSCSMGVYEGYILFNDIKYDLSFSVYMKFTIIRPRLKALLDLKHTSWSIDQKYGQFRLFLRALEVNYNVSVEEWLYGSPDLTYELLTNYDLVIAPDTASIVFRYYRNGSEESWFTLDYTRGEIEAIREYVRHKGVFMFFAMDYFFEEYVVNNMSNLNLILNGTGIQLVEDEINIQGNPVRASVVSSHVLMRGIQNLPYYGSRISVGPDGAEVLLRVENKDVMAVYSYFNGGALIVFGTNFFLDNWAFDGRYGVSETNMYNFVSNLVEFVLLTKNIGTVEVNVSDMTLFSDISLRFVNATPVSKVYGAIYGWNYEEYVELSFDVESKCWVGNLEFSVARDVFVSIIVELSDGSTVKMSKYYYVLPTENNPPVITSIAFENGSLINTSDYNKIMIFNFTIEDDVGLNVQSLRIKCNTTASILNETISEKVIYIEIRVNLSVLELPERNISSILISISVYDININYAEASFIYTVRLIKEERGFDWTIITVGILLVIFVVSVFVYVRRIRKKQK